jgi:hypothetical protein
MSGQRKRPKGKQKISWAQRVKDGTGGKKDVGGITGRDHQRVIDLLGPQTGAAREEQPGPSQRVRIYFDPPKPRPWDPTRDKLYAEITAKMDRRDKAVLTLSANSKLMTQADHFFIQRGQSLGVSAIVPTEEKGRKAFDQQLATLNVMRVNRGGAEPLSNEAYALIRSFARDSVKDDLQALGYPGEYLAYGQVWTDRKEFTAACRTKWNAAQLKELRRYAANAEREVKREAEQKIRQLKEVVEPLYLSLYKASPALKPIEVTWDSFLQETPEDEGQAVPPTEAAIPDILGE